MPIPTFNDQVMTECSISHEQRNFEKCPSSQPPGASDDPVFVHSMFRTGSTFLFGRFRRNEHYRCFFEPLNEGLFTLNNWTLSRYSGPQAAKRMMHEELDLPYFEEYQPLRRLWGGVRGYHARFAYHDFFREHDPALAEYIRILLASAATDGRQGMMKFVRSYGRLGFFRRLFPGQHLYLFRNPRDQWQSYMLKGRPYWMAMTCVIAALRPVSESTLSLRLNRPFPNQLRYLRLLGPLTVGSMLHAGKRYLRSLSIADTYRNFIVNGGGRTRRRWSTSSTLSMWTGYQRTQNTADGSRINSTFASTAARSTIIKTMAFRWRKWPRLRQRMGK